MNHLGRSFYRSFATVLGEAISNSWDADATKVELFVNRDKNTFVIKDNGVGMDEDDFQDKFLKIGYSKRKEGTQSKKGRPFIGRKGIGKLALLSCADKIAVISKVRGGDYVGGLIDNSRLDDAITEGPNTAGLSIGGVGPRTVRPRYTRGHKRGTIIYFDGVKQGIRNSFPFLAKTIALYFRFSLLDPTFSIFLDGKRITYRHLADLADKTEFLWKIGKNDDPFLDALESAFEPATMSRGT